MIIAPGINLYDDNGDAYVLEDVLGIGGFGSVYKARKASDGSVFAIKMLSSSFGNQEDLLSFQKEISQVKLISSNHVIKYLYTHDGSTHPEYPPYIIMEYANGGTLADLIERQRSLGVHFDRAFLLHIFVQLAEGMKDINSVLVHRDIKPENVLIHEGSPLISDFGISKLSAESTRTMTFKGYGTAKYIAPEAWNKDKNTIQMDIYSMGIVFYEMATLSYPYNIGPSADGLAYRNAHLFEAPRSILNANAVLPANIASVVIRMLEKSTQKRFQNWDEVISALNAPPLPIDDLSNAVKNVLNKQNERDLLLQKEAAQKNRMQEEKSEHRRLVSSQFDKDILEPIRELITRYESQYAGNARFSLKQSNSYKMNDRFSHTIHMPSGDVIDVETEVIFAENHQRRIHRDIFYGTEGYETVNYTPQCEKRDVLAWSQVSDKNGRGFNILLLKAEGELYGDWYVLKNTNSGLSRSTRVEPFGFNLSELPKEIHNVHVTHIYNLELSPMKESDLLDFVLERM